MKGIPAVVAELAACLKYERTAEDCYGEYARYFARWRIHRIEHWMCKWEKRARRRRKALEHRLVVLDSIPPDDRYPIDVTTVDRPEDIRDVFEYFRTMLSEARAQYQKGHDQAMGSKDAVSKKLLGRLQAEVETNLWHAEAKLNKIRLIGPVMYIAHHMH